jgi:hypothetical protein
MKSRMEIDDISAANENEAREEAHLTFAKEDAAKREFAVDKGEYDSLWNQGYPVDEIVVSIATKAQADIYYRDELSNLMEIEPSDPGYEYNAHFLKQVALIAPVFGKEARKAAEFEAGQLGRIETASTWTPAQAQAQAQSDVQYLREHAPNSSEALFHSKDMGLNARGSVEYRKELEKFPAEAAAAKQALVIGNPMPKADWTQAKEIVGGQTGKLYLPKIHTDYAGKIVMVTDTHIVQQVGKNTVIAHDLSRLENNAELKQLNAAGQLQGKQLKVSYGAAVGKQEVMTFSQVRAAEVSKTAKEYAEANIKTPKAREDFLKHVDKMMAAELARSKTQDKATPAAPAPRKEMAPTR